MNEATTGRVSRGVWAVGSVAIAWNALGAINFVRQMNPDAVAAMPVTQRAIIEGRPAFATAAFAIVAVTGVLGGILLLLRKSAAGYLFVASLIAVAVQTIPYVGMPAATFDISVVLYIAMPFAVAAWLVWYSKQAKRKGWIT